MDFRWFFTGRRRPCFEDPDAVFNEHDLHNYPRDEEINLSDSLFQHVEQMFTSSSIPFGTITFEEHTPNAGCPRSLMFKDPESKDCEDCSESKSSGLPKTDKFIDFIDNDSNKEPANPGLLLHKSSVHYMPQQFSYKKMSSVRTVRLPDGTFEEHRKMTDNQGNVTTTTRRSIGDQTYEVTTHEDKQGVREKEENFINLDESQKSDFEKRWLDIENRKMQIQEPRTDLIAPKSDLVLPKTAPAGDPSYLSLFKKFFSF